VSLAPYASAAPQQDCLTVSEWDDVERAALEECSVQHPDEVGVLAELARRYEPIDSGRAEALYRRALARDPGYADLRLALGTLLLRKGAAADARTEAETALRIQPNRRALLELLHAACNAGAC
jgi:tetratricopeptide (TPR) repeat protein